MAFLEGFNLRPRDFWIVGGTLLTTLVISAAGYVYSQNLDHARNQSRFETQAIAIEHDLISTMTAYGQILRGGVAFLKAKPNASRQEWRTYVEKLELEKSYPGIQAISFNALLKTEAAVKQFESRIRQTDWASFVVKPEGERDRYVPILYVEPLTVANQSALGFDIYSESNRRETIDRAIATGEPNLTAKITLVQEVLLDEPPKAQAGVLLIKPVFGASGGEQTDNEVSGFVVSVFRMGDLMTSVLQRSKGNPGQDVEVTLYDAENEDADAVLFDASTAGSREAVYTASARIELYGRSWLMKSRSTETFEARVATNKLNFLLAAGVLVSILLTLLFWGQAIRYRDAQIAAKRLHISNDRIADLMLEVNHRSKNLLGVVQAIARQTVSQDPENFAETFSERLGALSASQDILVKNQWTHVELDDLVKSQLMYLKDLIGTRVTIEGAEIRLSATHAQVIGMAIHELTTNAYKFGALSNDTGIVDIGWDIDPADAPDAKFRMWWTERNGPPVIGPTRTGFGSKVTTSMAEFALLGKISRTFDHTGFEWRLTCPASTILDEPQNTLDDIRPTHGA